MWEITIIVFNINILYDDWQTDGQSKLHTGCFATNNIRDKPMADKLMYIPNDNI